MKVALALGSGGARGYAHIGVIRELLERGHEIIGVSGSSMGALVGGIYAAGKLDEFEEWATSLTQTRVIRLVDPSISGPGLVKASKVLKEISRILDGALIEDLPIPFTAVAADVTQQREVWFQRGPVDMAVRASIGIPSVILPVRLHGRVLVDGGVLNPVPLEPIASTPADAIVAVRLSGRPAFHQAEAHGTEEPARESWTNRIMRSATGAIARFRSQSADSSDIEDARGGTRRWDDDFESLPTDLGMFDLVNSCLDTMQSMIERYRMAATPPDVLISIPGDAASTYDFHQAQRLIGLGRELAVEEFDQAGL